MKMLKTNLHNHKVAKIVNPLKTGKDRHITYHPPEEALCGTKENLPGTQATDFRIFLVNYFLMHELSLTCRLR
jgi:hypothetical protein